MSETQASSAKVNKHSRTGYVQGCRCEVCRSANREYQRNYMRKWRSPQNAEATTTS